MVGVAVMKDHAIQLADHCGTCQLLQDEVAKQQANQNQDLDVVVHLGQIVVAVPLT